MQTLAPRYSSLRRGFDKGRWHARGQVRSDVYVAYVAQQLNFNMDF